MSANSAKEIATTQVMHQSDVSKDSGKYYTVACHALDSFLVSQAVGQPACLPASRTLVLAGSRKIRTHMTDLDTRVNRQLNFT